PGFALLGVTVAAAVAGRVGAIGTAIARVRRGDVAAEPVAAVVPARGGRDVAVHLATDVRGVVCVVNGLERVVVAALLAQAHVLDQGPVGLVGGGLELPCAALAEVVGACDRGNGHRADRR